MSNFNREAVAALPGASWLATRRLSAFERLGEMAWPSTDEELWRYSRIGDLHLESFRPASPRPTTVAPDELARLRSLNPAAIAVTVDGSLAMLEVADGARFGLNAAGQPDDLGAVMATPTDLFAVANDTWTIDPLVVRVPRGVSVERPIVVVHVVTTDGLAVFPRLVVDAADNAEVTVLEQYVSRSIGALVVPVTEIAAAASARVRYLGINQLGPQVWTIGSLVAKGQRDSSVMLASVALGGDYARSRIDASAEGPGAHTEQIAVYFGEANQMHDFRVLQDHIAPKTTSNLLFKGAVEGHAASVYTGLIKVRKEAIGTEAFQANRNIKLSEGAWAESVPNLDIETNDVRCSHASAVGPIDEEQRFYIESRGVPTPVAERLIVTGFFDEVLTRLPVPEVIAPLRAQVAAKLDRRDI